ncbi:MAG TPA: hypothetical protein VIS03_00990 [Kiloniellaceae bacterium]
MRQGSRFAAVAFALLLAGCASSGGRSGDRAAVLDDARAHPENRLADAVACELTLASRSGEFPFAPFFAGLLDVPEAEGSRKFCAALIEAVIAGDFSQADQNAFQTPSDVRGRGPVGALLRTVLIAHERLGAQQAERPPQAQSCGCGQ